MEIEKLCSAPVALERIVCSMMETVVLEAALLLTNKSLLWLLLIGSLAENIDLFNGTNDRFPLDDLNKVKKPDAENKDAGEFDDDDGSDNDDHDEDDEDDDDSSEEESDDDGGNLGRINGRGSDDDDDDDNDDDDDDDDEEDSDDEDSDDEDSDDEDDDVEEETPPSKKNK